MERRWNLIVFVARHVLDSLPYKEETSSIFSVKKLIQRELAWLLAWLLSEANKYQQSFDLGHRATFYREGLKYQQKFAQSCLEEGELKPR